MMQKKSQVKKNQIGMQKFLPKKMARKKKQNSGEVCNIIQYTPLPLMTDFKLLSYYYYILLLKCLIIEK